MFVAEKVLLLLVISLTADSNVHGVNIGPIWGPRDPGGPTLAPWILPIWDTFTMEVNKFAPLWQSDAASKWHLSLPDLPPVAEIALVTDRYTSTLSNILIH